ncbi:hypothetical protein Hanom_Chr08g00685371 [Helianthus anomalus]
MFTNINERTQGVFMFIHLIKRTNFFVRVRSFIKYMNTNELPAEQVHEQFLNVRFIYRPIWKYCPKLII